MAVTPREREYMRRIGDIKAEQHRAARDEHLALGAGERLARSWQLYIAYRDSLPRREEEPPLLYDRARALGLYRP